MPTIDTVVISASGGDYTSLSAAEAGEQGNYVTADKIMEYSHQLAGDTTAVTFSGSTTDATRYIRVFAPSAWRHAGVIDLAKSYINNVAFTISQNHIRIDGVQFYTTSLSSNPIDVTAAATSAELYVSGCIVKSNANINRGMSFSSGSGGNCYVSNSIFIDVLKPPSSGAAIEIVSGWTVYCYNNTFHSCNVGIYRQTSGTVIAKNNLFRSCTTAAFGTFAAGTDYNATDNTSMGYTVTGGGNTHDRVGAFFTFVDESGDDFKLADGDAGAKRYGVDLSGDANLPFSTDITGATRSGTWDIGAHQHVSSAATGAKFVRYAESASTHSTTSTSLKSKCQLVLTASDQSPNTNYFIIAYAEVSNNTAGAKINLDLVNVTDSVTYQDLEPATALSNYGENTGQMLLGVYTSSSTPTEKIIEIKCCAISGTAQIKNAYIVIFKAGSNDFYNESLSKTDCTTSYVTKASITATTASGDYWVLGSCEALHSAGQYPYARIMIDSTLQTSCELLDTPTSSSRNALGLSCRETFTNASHTINYDIRDGGGLVDVHNARIFAIYLGDLPNNYYNEDLNNDTTPATSYEQQVSITNTLPAVKHLAIATLAARSSNTSSVDITTTMKIGGTIVSECKSRPRNTFAIECTDTTTLFSVFTGSGSTQTVGAGWHFSSSASGNLDDKTLLVIQLQASSGNFTESVSLIGATSISRTSNINCGSSMSLLNSSDLVRGSIINVVESITLLSAITTSFIASINLIKSLDFNNTVNTAFTNIVQSNPFIDFNSSETINILSLVNVNNQLSYTTQLPLILNNNIIGNNTSILQVNILDLISYYSIVTGLCAVSVNSILTNSSNINISNSLSFESLKSIQQSVNLLTISLLNLNNISEFSTQANINIAAILNLLNQLNFIITESVDSGGQFNESVSLNINSIISQLSTIIGNNLINLVDNSSLIYDSTLETDLLVSYLTSALSSFDAKKIVENSINFQKNTQIGTFCTSIYGIIIVEGIIASLNFLSQAATSGIVNNNISTALNSLGSANVNSLLQLAVYEAISQLADVPGQAPAIKEIFIRALDLLDKYCIIELISDEYILTPLIDYYNIDYFHS